MNLDIQTRGFPMTDALAQAVRQEADAFQDAFPGLALRIKVRLFDVNGQRGGPDKGCLVHTQFTDGTSIVGSDVDADLYRSVPAAFEKVLRFTKGALDSAVELAMDFEHKD